MPKALLLFSCSATPGHCTPGLEHSWAFARVWLIVVVAAIGLQILGHFVAGLLVAGTSHAN